MKVLMMVLLLALARENRKFNDGSNKVVVIEIEFYMRINLVLIVSFCRVIYFDIKISAHTTIFKKNILKQILKPSIYHLYSFIKSHVLFIK